MPLMLLGLIFAVGLFIYYMVSTSPQRGDENSEKKHGASTKEQNLKKEKNVIFLPDDIETIKKQRRKNK